MPDVSVVIPTRSRWRLLAGAALPSALEQREVDHEVIVVDDGSEDDTAERLASIADPRLRIIRHERSHGVARARNAGIEAARGAWVSFLDDDDVWSPHKLRAQLDAASAAGADFAYSAGAGLDADRKYLFAVAPPDPATIASRLLRWNVIWCGCSNVAARTALVRELGGFDEQLFQLADWDLWIRLALAGRAAAVPEVHVGYVMHADNMLLTHRRDVFPEFEYLAQKHAEASRAYGIAFDDGALLPLGGAWPSPRGTQPRGGAGLPRECAAPPRPRCGASRARGAPAGARDQARESPDAGRASLLAPEAGCAGA